MQFNAALLQLIPAKMNISVIGSDVSYQTCLRIRRYGFTQSTGNGSTI
jgi:hypothetical protein